MFAEEPGPGHPVWPSRGDHRSGSSCAPWSTSPTWCPLCRFWIFLGRKGRTSWWRRSGTSILPIPVQVTEVPKISSSSRRSRRVLRAPQTAEQLVEVPKIVSLSSLHGLVEQNVHIPVPHGRSGRGGGRGLQGLRPGQNSIEFGRAEHVDIPFPRGGGPQGFRPRQFSTASSSHSSSDADEVFTKVFRTHPHTKKMRRSPAPRGRN